MGVFSVIDWLEEEGFGKFEVFDDMYVSEERGLIISVQPPECWYSQKFPKEALRLKVSILSINGLKYISRPNFPAPSLHGKGSRKHFCL